MTNDTPPVGSIVKDEFDRRFWVVAERPPCPPYRGTFLILECVETGELYVARPWSVDVICPHHSHETAG
jgi:hypothetical protein